MNFDKSKAMKEIRKSITRFSIASKDFAEIGSQHPEDHVYIEMSYKQSRQNLETMIETLLDAAMKSNPSE